MRTALLAAKTNVQAGIVSNSIPPAITTLLLIAWIILGIIWLVGFFAYRRRGAGPYYASWNPYHGAGVAALVIFIIWLLFGG